MGLPPNVLKLLGVTEFDIDLGFSSRSCCWSKTIVTTAIADPTCTRFIPYSGSPSEVPSALADERSWCDGDRSFTVYSGWSCLGFLISLCHCIPVGEGTYTQGKSVNTNLICMEKVTVISSDSKSLWATQPHKESLPPNIAVKSRH
ncbi:hypothetical protein QQF64_022301 [Cirrhinus molitorella]|uniref:Uncharacterized protein n=1 Tax=Cirrhinus molitorella TaxID=172907 RepID=A0ABR3L835_9TELE